MRARTLITRSAGIISLISVLAVASCAPQPEQQKEEEVQAELRLDPASFDALPGWSNDDLDGIALAFGRSCARFARRDASADIASSDARFGTVGQWAPACSAVAAAAPGGTEALREAITTHLTPWTASDGGNPTGLFTGYYEPELNGSRRKTERYDEPLYPRPSDLVLVDLGNWRDAMKGERIAGRVSGGRLRPYDSREQIDGGSLGSQTTPIVWLDDPVDSFFLHIQGSGLVRLDDGSLMRVGYDGHNGHIYHAVGRTLIAWGEVAREDMSLQAIRKWMADNPDRMRELMHKNPSYIFFREIKGDGPIGAQGVALVPGRSLAVDRRFHAMGVPVYVDIETKDENGRDLQRLMIAQDTGGAIRGPVRGDVFWGAGAPAEALAGPMAAQGRTWLLLPKSVDPR
jgi:membrane-bound lytic murein transglycosylase A